jgi:hypothetical protein
VSEVVGLHSIIRFQGAKTDNTEEMMQQIMEMLVEMKEKMADRIADREERREAHKSLMAGLGLIKANTEKINSGVMQSIEEHHDVPSEDVAVMPVKGLKKRRRGRKSTAGRRGEPKKLNRGSCGSRKKLAAACREVSRRATVAWRKRNLIRQIRTEVNWGT